MEGVFLELLNRSIAASWLVLVIVIFRRVLKKVPKTTWCFLWAVVAVRLICPFSFESIFSLIPSAETVPQDILYAQKPEIDSGIYTVNDIINPVLSENFAPTVGDSVNPMQMVIYIASYLWVVGVIMMAVYAMVSSLRVYKKVAVSINLKDNIYLCDYIETPFILGIVKPRIYLPSTLEEENVTYVIAHEKAHLKRFDHWWKPLGFMLLCIYWFQPVIWIAYLLFCRDIELACDEKVIKEFGEADKKSYSNALLFCSVSHKGMIHCPLAFGEVGVKERIKAILNYKKPSAWIMAATVILCIAVVVCFLTNPKEDSMNSLELQNNKAHMEQSANGNEVNIQKISNESSSDGTKIENENNGEVNEIKNSAENSNLLEEAVHKAILERDADKTQQGLFEGLFLCESHVILGTEIANVSLEASESKEIPAITVYAMVLTQFYGFENGRVKDKGGSHMPVAMTFEVNEAGEYTLIEYWIPLDGSYYVSSIREKFPDEIEEDAIDTQKFIYAQIQNCYEQAVQYANLNTDKIVEGLLEEIVASPSLESGIDLYIANHSITYRELIYYGKYTLQYCFQEFLKGGQTDLRGLLMAEVCKDISAKFGEALLMDYEPENGQDWFEEFRENAESLEKQYGMEEMAESYPVSWIFLQMLEAEL